VIHDRVYLDGEQSCVSIRNVRFTPIC